MNQNDSTGRDLETAGIAALAVASKTPFKTAFKVTMGIGLARALMVSLVLGGGVTLFLIYTLLTK